MKQDKYKYSIGDYVVVAAPMVRRQQGSIRLWCYSFRYRTPRIGQVVGLCTRYDGEIKGGGMNSFGGYDPPYFVPSKAHHFWLVRFGLTNKPIEVSEGDMRLAGVDEVIDLPYSYPPPSVSERDKKNLSVDSKNWPRDEKGRWIEGPVVHHN